MKSFILLLYDYFSKRKLIFWLVLASIFVLLSFLASRITFEEDISKMLQMDEKTREYSNIVQNTKLVDKLVVSISFIDSTNHNEQLLMNYADSLEARLLKYDKNFIKKITLRNDDLPFSEVYSVILRNLPLFIDAKDYTHFDSLLSPESITNHLSANLKLLASPASVVISQTMSYDPIGISLPFVSRLQQMGNSSGFDIYNGYFFANNHRKLIFFIEPANPSSETGKNTKLLDNIDAQVKNLKGQSVFKNVSCNYIGATAIAVGNSRQIQRDTMLSLFVLILIIITLTAFIFRKKRTPILIFAPVLFGLVFALAMVAFIKPTISIIAIGASSVLLGIAVNYPLHILTHYLHEKNLRLVVADMIVPMTIGSATTIGGFLCLLFVKAEILHDLGLLGAFSLIGAALFSLIFLPHLIGEMKPADSESKLEKWLEKTGKLSLETKKIPLLIILILTPYLFYLCLGVKFDSDLANLNYMNPELKAAEKELKGYDSLSYSLYIITYGKNLDQSLVAASRIGNISDSLTKIRIRNNYTGVSGIIPSSDEQTRRLQRWKQYWTPEKKEKLISNLSSSANTVGFKKNAFINFINLIESPSEQIDSSDNQFLIETFGRDAITVNQKMSTVISVMKIPSSQVAKIAPVIEELPNTTLLDQKFMANQLLKIINDDFNFIAVFSALLVFIALLLTYGRIELALTAFIPMVISWIWILGLMNLFNLKFNIVNIILSTFIFGLGDDYTIFIMDGLLQEYKTGKKPLPVIKISIVLSGFTTLIGFGVLLLAKHPALKSIAAVSLVGIFSVLFISLTVEPFLFNLFIKKPINRKQAPISFLTLIKSILVFGFFILGSLGLSIAAFFLVYVNPFNKEKGKQLLNIVISKFMWLQVYMFPNIKKKIFYTETLDYSKPFIIISNHHSVIDILMVGMLSPKIIPVTNKWVWNSPIFGFVVRMAGYCHTIEGVEATVDQLREGIAKGYSVAIFPEGTRSVNNQIHRFHKGAFHIADELKLDIVPIILHGTDRCIQKGSFIVRDATISLKVLPRIHYTDKSYGLTYQERTKNISRYFKNEYKKFSDEIETPGYYRKAILDNYLFKGPVLEWYMKIKLNMEKNYQIFHELVPVKGKIIDVGCGYGFMSYMLAFLSSGREITAFDYDEEKIEIAKHGFAVPANLQFTSSDVSQFDFNNSDCIIFSDVLHYLTPDELQNEFRRCAQNLNPGGLIIVRDGDKSKSKAHFGTRLSELFSTKIFRFNKTQNNLNFFSCQFLFNIAENIGLSYEIPDQKKWASNTIMIFRKK